MRTATSRAARRVRWSAATVLLAAATCRRADVSAPPPTGQVVRAGGSVCGDGACTAGETACDCPGECQPECGDGCCTAPEGTEDCPADCVPEDCGDDTCGDGETCANCAVDCPGCRATCGDGFCVTAGESCAGCPTDCGACEPDTCGDGACDPAMGEDPCNCPGDCGGETVCGDDVCSGGDDCEFDCGAPPAPRTPADGEELELFPGAVFTGGPDALPVSLRCDGQEHPLAPGARLDVCGLCVVMGTPGDDELDFFCEQVGVAFGGTGDDRIDGHDGTLWLLGGPGDDFLDASDGEDRVAGEDGDDTVRGNVGGDRIWGGAGNDVLFGKEGDDHLYGGPGEDVLSGSDGNDVLLGETGEDLLRGRDGDDWLRGGDGNDQLYGGRGDDVLADLVGHNLLFGSFGNDVLRAGDGDDVVRGSRGDDALDCGHGDDYCSGGPGHDRVRCGPGDDHCRGRGGSDRVDAGPGQDNVKGNAGADVVDAFDGEQDFLVKGSDGVDIVYVDDDDPLVPDNEDEVHRGANPAPLPPSGCVPSAAGCPDLPRPEVCDGADQDCDGEIDESDGDPANDCGGVCPLAGAVGAPCDGPDRGSCAEGTLQCDGFNRLLCDEVPNDHVEACNGVDDDCDARVDEAAAEGPANACGGVCELDGSPGEPCDLGGGEEGTVCCTTLNQVACTRGGCNRFVVFGDFGTASSAQFDVADAMARHCGAFGCDYAWTTGDNIYGNGISEVCDDQMREKFESVYCDLAAQENQVPDLCVDPALARSWCDDDGAFKVHVTIGNHDLNSMDGVQAMVDYTTAGVDCGLDPYSGLWCLPHRYYARRQGEVEFFALDTSLEAENTRDPVQQADMIEAIEASNARWKIAVGHHPLLSNGNHGAAQGGLRDFLEAVLCDGDRPRVDFYLCGHDHHLEHLAAEAPCDLQLIVSGGGGAGTRGVTRNPGIPAPFFAEESHGFFWFNIAGNLARFAAVDETGLILYEGQVIKR